MQTRERLDALTTLRFFAASMIVLGHAHPIFGSFGIAQAMPVNQGVSFFFVLSGFILAWNYPVLDDTPSRVQFWWVRFARIWPLHAVTCLMWIVLVTPIEGGANFLDPKELTKLVTNLALLQVWVPYKVWSLSYNGVAWSISAEFSFTPCSRC